MFQSLKKQFLVGTALVGGAFAPVFAAVPAGVTSAIADVGADSIIVATAFLVAAIGLAAFLYMRRGAK